MRRMQKSEPNNIRASYPNEINTINDRSRDKEIPSGLPHGRVRSEAHREEIIKIARCNDLYERQSI